MTRKFLLLLITTNFFGSVMACDVCGCSLSGYMMGVLPDQNSQFAGLRFNLASFHSEVNHASSNPGIEFSNDVYQRLDFIGRISLAPKVKLNLVMPYVMNTMRGSSDTMVSDGIGDPSAVFFYQPFKGKEKWKNQSLSVGSGVKFPLGRFNNSENGTIINPNFQHGTGSFDFVLTSNYVYRKKMIGFAAESSYKLNTANSNGYRFGNQFNFSPTAFCTMGHKQLKMLILLGLYAETAARHTDGGKMVSNTGGYGIYYNGGVQLYYKKLRVGMAAQLPLKQKFIADNITTITAGPRFSVDVFYFFGN